MQVRSARKHEEDERSREKRTDSERGQAKEAEEEKLRARIKSLSVIALYSEVNASAVVACHSRRTNRHGQNLELEVDLIIDREVAGAAARSREESTLGGNILEDREVAIVRGRVVDLEREVDGRAVTERRRGQFGEGCEREGEGTDLEFLLILTSSRLPPPKEVEGLRG